MSDELKNEVKKALSDLEGNAPAAPRWQDMTASFTRLTAKQPGRVWSRSAVALAAAAVTIVVVGVGLLFGSKLGTDPVPIGGEESSGVLTIEDLVGVWTLESYTFDGTTVSGDDVAPDRRQPYIDITIDATDGHAGCNGFGGGPPELEGNTLFLGEVFMTLASCMEPTAEPAMTEALWSPTGVTVALDGDAMTWQTDTVELVFARQDRIPQQAATPWPQQAGRLDCSPSYVISADFYGDLSGKDLPNLFPDVVEVEGTGILGSEDPWAYGLDASGIVIAQGAQGDIQPVPFQVSACSEAFNMKPDFDPATAIATYADETGLGQRNGQVWGNRFVALCVDPTHPIDGARYLSEDAPTSLLPGGEVPSAEQVADAIEAVRDSVCANEPSNTSLPTTTSTVTVPPEEVQCLSSESEELVSRSGFSNLPELPDSVQQARLVIIEHAFACNHAALVELAWEGVDGEWNDTHWWGAGLDVAAFQREPGALDQLVRALISLPYEYYETDGGYYQWPPRADIGEDTLRDFWDPETIRRVAEFTGQSEQELIDGVESYGGYSGFRVGIANDGRWLFALAGD